MAKLFPKMQKIISAVMTGELDAKSRELDRLGDIFKAISLSDPLIRDILRGTGQLDGHQNKLAEPYNQIVAVQACIKWKARNFAQVPFKIYKGDQKGEEELTSGPIIDLFNTINPTLDPFQFWEGISTSLDMRGNGYIIKDDQEVNGVPVYLWVANPAWMKPAYARNGEEFVGWWYDRGGKGKPQQLRPERVIQVKYYNPYEEILGLSPLEVLGVTNQTLWGAGVYNKEFFENDATPNSVYTHPDKTPERILKEAERNLVEAKKGVANAQGTMVLTGGWDVKAVGLSQKDIQFLEQQKFGREDICMIYGVPKKILGLYEDINMATAISAELQFWEDTVKTLSTSIEYAINAGLLEPLGYYGAFDFSSIDVLNQRTLEKVESVTKLLATGQFTRNELNQRFSLGFEDQEWGDEPVDLLGGFGSGEQMAAPVPDRSKVAPVIEWPEAQMETIDIAEGMRAAKWAKDMEPLLPIMKEAATAARNYWHDVWQKIMKSLTKKVDGVRVMKAPEDELLKEAVDAVEDAISDEAFFEALKASYEKAIQMAVVNIAADGFTMDNMDAIALLQSKLIQVKEMNETGKKEIVEKMRKALTEALEEGVGSAEQAKRLIDAVGDQVKNIQSRAKTIARTEVNSAFTQVRQKAIEADPPDFIRWISSRDSKVRDSHRIDGQTVPYGEKFSNGLKYPHDPNGAADEVINCRCTFEPVWGK